MNSHPAQPLPAAPTPTMFGDLELDVAQRRFRRAGRPGQLTPGEWRLLALLAEHAPHTLSRQRLAALLSTPATPVSENAVAVHLCNLRRKLGRGALETIRGHGVRLRAAA